MPSFELETSIPLRLHANAAEAQVHHLAWLKEMGLISDSETARDYARQGAVSAMTYTFAQIPYSGLCLAADMAGITVFLDDYCSHGRPLAQVAKLINSLEAIILDPVEQHHNVNNPILLGWLNAWQRYGDGMSTSWKQRTLRTWQNFLSVWIEKALMQVLGISGHCRWRRCPLQ